MFGIPHTARRRLGCARPSHPRLGSLPVNQSLAGRPLDTRDGGVPGLRASAATDAIGARPIEHGPQHGLRDGIVSRTLG